MGRKGNNKSIGRGKAADRGGAHTLPHHQQWGRREVGRVVMFQVSRRTRGTNPLSLRWFPGQTTATSSPRSPTPPPEDLPARKGGARRIPASDTQQSMVDVSFF